MKRNQKRQADPANQPPQSRPQSPSISLKIRVDGVVLTHWRVTEAEPLQLEIDGSAELVELIAEDELGEFPLTSVLIPFDAASGRQLPTTARVELQAPGRVLGLRLMPGRPSADAEAESRTHLELNCRVAAATNDADAGP